MAIYKNSTNELITEVVSSATSFPDVIQITNRTLDGAYHVQSIGEAGTKVDVVAYFQAAGRALLDTAKRECDEIKVIFDGFYYIGLIDGELKWSRLPNQGDLWYAAQFTLLATSEGVA